MHRPMSRRRRRNQRLDPVAPRPSARRLSPRMPWRRRPPPASRPPASAAPAPTRPARETPKGSARDSSCSSVVSAATRSVASTSTTEPSSVTSAPPTTSTARWESCRAPPMRSTSRARSRTWCFASTVAPANSSTVSSGTIRPHPTMKQEASMDQARCSSGGTATSTCRASTPTPSCASMVPGRSAMCSWDPARAVSMVPMPGWSSVPAATCSCPATTAETVAMVRRSRRESRPSALVRPRSRAARARRPRPGLESNRERCQSEGRGV